MTIINGRLLHMAGFVNIRRVRTFGLFNDSIALLFKGKVISLDMIAQMANAQGALSEYAGVGGEQHA